VEDKVIYRWSRGRVPTAECMDPNVSIQSHRSRFSLTHFVGESFPRFRVDLGPVILGAFLGCPLTLADYSSWQYPILKDWPQVNQVQWDESNRWWKAILRVTQAAVADSNGDYVVGIPDMGAAGDVAANLRGNADYLMDLYDHPDQVLALEEKTFDWWLHAYDRLYSLIAPLGMGSTSWLRAWSSGRTYPVQCDISALASTKMFERFFLPTVIRQAQALDRCIYHLDGPDATRHLQLLLDCDDIHAIQWMPGVGSAPMVEWTPFLKRIQDGKKALHISAMPWEVPRLLEELAPEGLMIETWTETMDQANGLLRLAEKTAVAKSLRWQGLKAAEEK